jgi:hypothetical protein
MPPLIPTLASNPGEREVCCQTVPDIPSFRHSDTRAPQTTTKERVTMAKAEDRRIAEEEGTNE